MLGDEGRDLGLSDYAVVEGEKVGVGVDDSGGDAVEMSDYQFVDSVGDQDVRHAHLTACIMPGTF